NGPKWAIAFCRCDWDRLAAGAGIKERSGEAQAARARPLQFRERMECCSELDAVGCTPVLKIRTLIFVLLFPLIFLWIGLFAQSGSSLSNNEAVVRKLFNEQRWQDIVEQVRRLPHRSADLDFYYGSALAQLSQWALAREIFWEGHRLRPSDKRFPTELA